MYNLLISIIFGIVEGISEWLPISSTGHMILLNEFLVMNVSDEFYRMYEVVIQLGAILAVIILFWEKIFPFKHTDEPLGKGLFKYIDKKTISLLTKIVVAAIPSAIVGILFDDYFEALFYNPFCVALALIIFGIAFIVIEYKHKNKKPIINSLEAIDYKTALIIGLFQVLAAVFPGTSRSGATIIGALLIGVARGVSAEFTFILGIPSMLGASLLRILKFGFVFTFEELLILFSGAIVAFLVSLCVVKMLMNYIQKHSFSIFGYYRIIIGIIVLVYFMVI